MKILFMGSAAFAVPSLEALATSGHEIALVVTRPDKPAGRGMHIASCPVAQAALGLGLPLFQPKKVKDAAAIDHFRALSPELVVVVAYGRILSKEFLEIPTRGCVNVHASLLPSYRGAAPINWAVINGEKETGVTTQRIVEELDAGDILLSCSTAIDEAETAVELHDRLGPMGADLLTKTIDGIAKGTIKPRPQDCAKATYAPILKKEDGHIIWSEPAAKIYNRIRGLKPWPGTYAKLEEKTLRIHEAAALPAEHKTAPGTVIESGPHLAIACGEGALYLLEVQLEGKKRMSAADFLRGHKVQTGTVLT
ncbi:MAG: methionyl-tRNA formyltransferase [Pseudomonadota bacterium]